MNSTMVIHFPIDTQLTDGSTVRLALAERQDVEPLRRLHELIVEEGTSYPHELVPPGYEFRAFWFGGCGTVIAFAPDRAAETALAGAYYLKANWPGRGSHVANAGFIVAPTWRRKGLGRLLGETMLTHARALGFRSVIFNLVFAENQASRHLWERLGFRTLASIPQAVRKSDGTYQDALIMFRSLIEESK